MTAATIALSLISHTNAGKTTLARTLLGRDVGEVRDAPHVTTEASSWPLVATPEGDALLLWDTPGFGDSARLARRLAQQGNPIGWFLAEVWDRFRDRPFYLTQLAVRNVRDSADVVLYLVNAAEAPEDAGYLEPELAVLGWIGKPVVVLLNQTGPPRPAAVETAEIERWRIALQRYPVVHSVLPLDAFARCWVQEFALFEAIEQVLPAARRPVMARLAAAWRQRRWTQFDDAMVALAEVVAAAVGARVVLPAAPMLQRITQAISAMRRDGEPVQEHALQALTRQLDRDLRVAMEQLINVYELDGRAAAEVEARLATDVVADGRIDEGKAAAIGGIVSGAMTGLAADLAVGGLSFGAGMLTGALLGAFGGAGVARGVNVARGKTDDAVRWDDAFLDALLATLLLRYLAVAHHGRGRGEWHASEYPPFWRERVLTVLAAMKPQVSALWELRSPATDAAARRAAAQRVLGDAGRALLDDLYPPIRPAQNQPAVPV
ncbi:MAG: DUF3482 domain-containing protein [Casimicrobiaceae bacterium]